MSSSASRTRVKPQAVPLEGGAQPDVSPFPYSEVSGCQVGSSGQLARTGPDSAALAAQAFESDARARELGRQQGEMESHARFEESLAHDRSSIAKAVADFHRERVGYYRKIEEEAVRLALRIARKVLHREAQVDPLLLMGIVRVALGRIAGATGVTLAVRPEKAADWRRFLASAMEPAELPEVVEDSAMALDECELRTSMGSAALGLEVQLKEIELGLMDLLAARPQEKQNPWEQEKEKLLEQEKQKPQERAKPQEKTNPQEKTKPQEKEKP
jgi:flagellar assembly protein FliH